MSITRKSRFELWPEGSDKWLSQHNDERQAIDAAQSLPPGTHTIRIKGEIYLEVVVPGTDFVRTTIDGIPHIRVTAISITVNGSDQPIVVPVSAGDDIAVIVNGVTLGTTKA